jgi:ABC-2 type transport system permease protein
MSVAVRLPPVELTAAAEPPAHAGVAIVRRAFRQLRTSAIVCAVAFGGTVASTALSYVATFPDEASRRAAAAALSSDAGFAVLLGPVTTIDTVGGYTVYKCFVFLTTIGAIWALLAATRLLRGEEDAGRWQLVLAGRTTAAGSTVATLIALAGAVTVVTVGIIACTMLAGRNPDVGFGAGATVLYGLSLGIPLAVFAGVGAVTSQLGRTRRMATGMGMGVFGISFFVRMVADSGPDRHWLRWATPFGWTELMAPFTENDARPLVPAFVSVVALGVTATLLSARRDAGDGVLASNDVSKVRHVGLTSALGLAARLDRGVMIAWCLGALASGAAFGIIGKIATGPPPGSMADTLVKFGVQGTFLRQYFGVAFLIVASVVALLPAGQLGAASDEELSGRLVHILSRPPHRVSWFAGRLLLAAVGATAAGFLAGFGAWAAARSQGVDLELWPMVGAGLNVVPIALVALGIGAVVFAVVPRFAAGAVYGVVFWSLIIDLVSSMVTGAKSLDRLSLFHYMALAPAQDPDPKTLALTTLVAAALCLTAAVLFDRRDVHST